MKTLKIFIALCFILTFVSINVNAQNQNGVEKTNITVNMGGQYLECTGDYLWGDITLEVFTMPNLTVMKLKTIEKK